MKWSYKNAKRAKRGTVLDYKILKIEVEKRIPKDYLNEVIKPLVNEKDNIEPATVNNTNMSVPQNIHIIDKKNGQKYIFNYEGQRWFLSSLLCVKTYGIRALLSPLFIFSFIKQYEDRLYDIDRHTFQKLSLSASTDLVNGDICLPHHRSKNLFMESEQACRFMLDLLAEENCLKDITNSPILLADIIVGTVTSCTSSYDFYYEYCR